MFKILGNKIETLKLSQTNLQEIDQIDFRNMINLKYLDLSINNLTFVNSTSFDCIKNLEYLDLSWNKLFEFNVVLNKLKYLNIEQNQINQLMIFYMIILLLKHSK